jgi:hypothetical protein
MSNTPAFRYRYGLSFPGQITDEALAPVDFRAVVQQVAERMCDSCAKKHILYDRYRQGVFARPALRRLAVPPWRRRHLVVDVVHKAPCLLPGQRQRLRETSTPGHPSTLHLTRLRQQPPAAIQQGRLSISQPTSQSTSKPTSQPTTSLGGQVSSRVGRPVISQSRP